MRRACSHSCSSVLASLAQLATSVVSITSPNRLWTSVARGVKPPSRKVAPISASSASARIDARSAPPPRASPSPRRSDFGQAELRRGAVQAVLAHQVGANAGQVAFVGVAEAVEQQAGDGQAQDRVAEELEPLVVVGAEAAMRERPFQQRRIGEAVADALLQCVEAGNPCVKAAVVDGPTRLVRAALELDEEEDRLHKFDFLVVGEETTTLSFSFVISGPCREMVVIEYSMSFWRSKALRISGRSSLRSAILLTARLIVKYSFSAGSTRIPISATKPTTMAQNSRPNSVMPRWRLARLDGSCAPPCAGEPVALSGRTDALQVAEIHPDEERPADDVLVGHEAPVAGVVRIVAVVAHHEVVARGHLAGHAFGTVAAVLAERK